MKGRVDIAMEQRIVLLADNNSGRVEAYLDLKTFENLSEAEFIRRIRQGMYPDYRLEYRDGAEYPVHIPTGEKPSSDGR